MVANFAGLRAVPDPGRIRQIEVIGATVLPNLEVPMKTLILTATLIAATLSTAPAQAAFKAGLHDIGVTDSLERRGTRTPGGSGCDGKGDVGKPGC